MALAGFDVEAPGFLAQARQAGQEPDLSLQKAKKADST